MFKLILIGIGIIVIIITTRMVINRNSNKARDGVSSAAVVMVCV